MATTDLFNEFSPNFLRFLPTSIISGIRRGGEGFYSEEIQNFDNCQEPVFGIEDSGGLKSFDI